MSDGAPAPARYARVVIDSRLPALDREFEYRIPPSTADVTAGVRVRVPLRGGRMATGWVTEVVAERAWEGEVSDVERLISPVPVLQPEVWELARSVADRAAGGAADVLRVAIPARQARVETAWLSRGEVAGPTLPEVSDRVAEIAGASSLSSVVTGREKVALECAGGVADIGALTAPSASKPAAAAPWVGRWALTLAVLARQALDRDEQAIIVVPDHREQRQLAAALAAVVGEERVVELDARQANPDRYRAFLRCVAGESAVIIGPRSTVYAPAARLGLLAIWDDGDQSMLEPLAPWVHARDASLVRQSQSGCALVFAGHTRSTDVARLVEVGFLRHERVGEHRVKGMPAALADDAGRLPELAFQAMRRALETAPVLVQVARPGHAPGLKCAECGHPARCSNCRGPLVRRRRGAVASCRLCGRLAAAWRCSECGGGGLADVGRGSARVAEEFGRAFPGVPIVVADGEHQHLETDSRPRIIVATRGAEPIAAGGYGAVILLDGDRMLARAGLRVSEDAVRHWLNARALAADGAQLVLAGVVGPAAAAVASGTAVPFAAFELAERKSLLFPPAVRTATITGQPDAVAEAVEAFVAADPPVIAGNVLGPVATDDDGTAQRAIVRVPYRDGSAAAQLARGLVRSAAARPRRGGEAARLRIRFDDPEPFDGL